MLSFTAERPRLSRPEAAGKFLYVGKNKLWLRGVTYGPFACNGDGEYRGREAVEHDFAQIASHGFNAIRTYTVPPRWLLDVAQHQGLWVMVGLAWEQHVAFLEDRKQMRSIRWRVRAGVRACVGHSAVLCYAVGNEIPAPIVRWYGPRRLERWMECLFAIAHDEDPEGLFTYVNYPSTEYLEFPFADLVCFNVYLESQERLAAYVGRLQNIAGNRPLLLTEIGLDSFRNGKQTQARVLEWQVRTAFEQGCAGAFVFAWTDQWHRGGYEITEWDFGLTDRDGQPKPALASVRRAFDEVPFRSGVTWPRVSVIVCTCNGSRTIRDCCEGLLTLEYPDFEVIVVDDGSTDRTAEIVEEYGFRVIRTTNCGLGSARNTGLAAATGKILAYIDDDAYPDPHWLTYLAHTLLSTEHAGVGGPNVPPPGDGPIAECVANAWGGPIHVLLSDQIAEHIPGCNMAFWKDKLEAIGGFDVRYHAAGDDIDVCWRLQQRGWSLGFNPAAMVWHHRRNSVQAYWKQQKGYGRAEALLEQKWPEKYNGPGHVSWAGRVYSVGSNCVRFRRRIFHGVWGSAPFQSVYQPSTGLLASLPMMPEWYLVVACLAALSALGSLWKPLWFVAPVAAFAATASLRRAWASASKSEFSTRYRSRASLLKMRGITAFLCLIQPMARLIGRMSSGLTPWRRRGIPAFQLPIPRRDWIWSERWRSLSEWLQSLESGLRQSGAVVIRGGEFDHWDLEVRNGTLGAIRIRATVEEHGAGRQMVRFWSFPRLRASALVGFLVFGILCADAWIDGARWPAVLLGIPAAWFLFRIVFDSGIDVGLVVSEIAKLRVAAAKAVQPQAVHIGERTYVAAAVAAASARGPDSRIPVKSRLDAAEG